MRLSNSRKLEVRVKSWDGSWITPRETGQLGFLQEKKFRLSSLGRHQSSLRGRVVWEGDLGTLLGGGRGDRKSVNEVLIASPSENYVSLPSGLGADFSVR